MKEVFAITTRTTNDGTEQSFWDRIGVAFECKDGSLDLKLNLVPADLGATSINIRDPRPRGEQDDKPAQPKGKAKKSK